MINDITEEEASQLAVQASNTEPVLPPYPASISLNDPITHSPIKSNSKKSKNSRKRAPPENHEQPSKKSKTPQSTLQHSKTSNRGDNSEPQLPSQPQVVKNAQDLRAYYNMTFEELEEKLGKEEIIIEETEEYEEEVDTHEVPSSSKDAKATFTFPEREIDEIIHRFIPSHHVAKKSSYSSKVNRNMPLVCSHPAIKSKLPTNLHSATRFRIFTAISVAHTKANPPKQWTIEDYEKDCLNAHGILELMDILRRGYFAGYPFPGSKNPQTSNEVIESTAAISNWDHLYPVPPVRFLRKFRGLFY